jgi:hypothetical protein
MRGIIKMAKLYRGVRQNNEAKVFVDNEELSLVPSKLVHPSEATPEWGYFGDGPSQLSLAILLDATGDRENSLKYMHDFKFEFIANARYDIGFTILESQVVEWLEKRISSNNSGGWAI